MSSWHLERKLSRCRSDMGGPGRFLLAPFHKKCIVISPENKHCSNDVCARYVTRTCFQASMGQEVRVGSPDNHLFSTMVTRSGAQVSSWKITVSTLLEGVCVCGVESTCMNKKHEQEIVRQNLFWLRAPCRLSESELPMAERAGGDQTDQPSPNLTALVVALETMKLALDTTLLVSGPETLKSHISQGNRREANT